jgi:hypothetical protein
LDLFHAFQSWPEGAPEHVPAVLAIAYAAETEVELYLDNVFDGFIFQWRKLGGGLVVFVARIEEGLRALERTEMFGAEGRTAVERGHDGVEDVVQSWCLSRWLKMR